LAFLAWLAWLAAWAAVPVTGAAPWGAPAAWEVGAWEVGAAADLAGAAAWLVFGAVGAPVLEPVLEPVPARAVAGLLAAGLEDAPDWPSAAVVGWLAELAAGAACFACPDPPEAVDPELWEVVEPDPWEEVEPDPWELVEPDPWEDDEAVLLAGFVTELTMEPTAPVTGAVTPWTVFETPDVRPESNDGWPAVAASACRAGRDRSKQIPQPAIVNRAAWLTTRRVFGFDIDHSLSPGGTLACRTDARLVWYLIGPGVSRAPVAGDRSVRSPPYKCTAAGNRPPGYLPGYPLPGLGYPALVCAASSLAAKRCISGS
jgi:hypothetical protein